MADNLTITQGSGTTIATDDVGGSHYQKVKLVDGTADSSTAIAGDGTNGLDVDVTRLPVGRWVDVTLSLDTNIYADGDVLADTQAVAVACAANDQPCHLKSLVVVDKDDQGYPMTAMLFSSNVSLGTENSAPSISDANAAYYLGKVEVGTLDFDDLGGVRVARVECDVPIQPASGTDDVYVAVLSRGTGTYTASGVVMRFYFE